MSAAEALVAPTDSVVYQYNAAGTVRAPVCGDAEVLLDTKLVPQSYATPENLATLGGQVQEARAAGFELSFVPASQLGIEVLNELNGQWRPVTASGTFGIVARLPN